MHYLIFIPKVSGAKNDLLRDFGMESLLREGGPCWGEVSKGPDGGRGMVATWQRQDDTPKLEITDSQKWFQGPEDQKRKVKIGSYWIGYDPKDPPSPKDLAFTKLYDGDETRLADGQFWQIPIARKLPSRHGINPHTGEHRRIVRSEFREYWDLSEKFAKDVFTHLELTDFLNSEPDDVSIPIGDTWDFACKAVGMNYRVTPAIISELELLDDLSLVAVVVTAIELNEIKQVRDQKKTSVSSPIALPTAG